MTDERQRFEAWAVSNDLPVDRATPGGDNVEYCDWRTDCARAAWCAALAALAAHSAAQDVPATLRTYGPDARPPDEELEELAGILEQQHTWLTNVAASAIVRKFARDRAPSPPEVAPVEQPQPEPWHQAVLEECMLTEGNYDPADPIKTVRALIDWHVRLESGARLRDFLREPAVAWQPIETAPKDGTTVLLVVRHVNAKYASDPWREGWIAAIPGHWISFNGGGWTWGGLAGTPTHWMPLPAPPLPTEQGGTNGR